MRIIALDLGTKKCGVAITDPMQIIAQPLLTIYYSTKDYYSLINQLNKIIKEYQPIEKIVLGLPKNIDNSLSPSSKNVLLFKKKFEQENREIIVDLIDEKYSSKNADELMSIMNYSIEKKKKSRDQLAAQKILENYLLFNKK